MLGEHGKHIADCLENNYIGAGFVKDYDLTLSPYDNEQEWRKLLVEQYLSCNTEKSIGTARTSIGFLWTICFGLKIGDIVLASNGNGGYHVGEITGNYYFEHGTDLPHRRSVTWSNVVIERRSMSKNLQNSTGSIGTCCNITKYAEELNQLIGGGVSAIISPIEVPFPKQ